MSLFLQEGALVSYLVGTNRLWLERDARKVHMPVYINSIEKSSITTKIDEIPVPAREINISKVNLVKHLFRNDTKTTISHTVLNESARSITGGISTANNHIPAS